MGHSAALDFIGQGPEFTGGLAPGLLRWGFGSTHVGVEHLVTTATPRPLVSYAKVINGPWWSRRNRVRSIGWVTVHGWHMRSVYVPAASNDRSAFGNHVALVWTVGDHSYAFGFHDLHGIRHTLLLDEALARHVTLVGP
jgi:hypothetical protein